MQSFENLIQGYVSHSYAESLNAARHRSSVKANFLKLKDWDICHFCLIKQVYQCWCFGSRPRQTSTTISYLQHWSQVNSCSKSVLLAATHVAWEAIRSVASCLACHNLHALPCHKSLVARQPLTPRERRVLHDWWHANCCTCQGRNKHQVDILQDRNVVRHSLSKLLETSQSLSEFPQYNPPKMGKKAENCPFGSPHGAHDGGSGVYRPGPIQLGWGIVPNNVCAWKGSGGFSVLGLPCCFCAALAEKAVLAPIVLMNNLDSFAVCL